MINQAQYITLDLDKPRRLRFDLNFIANLEEEYNLPIASIIQHYSEVYSGVGNDDISAFSIRDMRKMIRAALLDSKPGISLEQVGQMMIGCDLTECTARMLTALNDAIAGPGSKDKSKRSEGKPGEPGPSGSGGTGQPRDVKPSGLSA